MGARTLHPTAGVGAPGCSPRSLAHNTATCRLSLPGGWEVVSRAPASRRLTRPRDFACMAAVRRRVRATCPFRGFAPPNVGSFGHFRN